MVGVLNVSSSSLSFPKMVSLYKEDYFSVTADTKFDLIGMKKSFLDRFL
jgi:hypothetical protein